MKKTPLLFLLLLFHIGTYARKEGHIPNLQNQPLVFQENKGQIRDQNGQVRKDIDFIFQTPDMTLFIGKGQLHYQFLKQEKLPMDTSNKSKPGPQSFVRAGRPNDEIITVSRLDVTLAGADKNAVILKEAPQKARYNYYADNAGAEGITGVSTYRKITYKNIYPHIDWILYTNGENLKYDFIIHPGGKVSDIRLKYDGSDRIKLKEDGSLKITTPAGSLEEQAPYAYEAQSKKEVATQFILNNNIAAFKADPYDGTLIIDPGVEWATYYFPASSYSTGKTISSDDAGNIYVSGIVSSGVPNLATTGAFQDTFAGGSVLTADAFLAAFDTLGDLKWATYYGGGAGSSTLLFAGGEIEARVTTDAFGHVYLCGTTYSENGIATPGSFQETLNPFNVQAPYAANNAYLVQFNHDGVRQWGTYFGAGRAGFLDVACDKNGNVYAVGFADPSTGAAGLITPNAHQEVSGGGDAFIAAPGGDGLMVKFDSAGNRLWATYYGGEGGTEWIQSVSCDDSNNVYITGRTNSKTGLNTKGAFMEEGVGSDNSGFLAKFDSDGVRIWGTFLAGMAQQVALDPSNNHLYVSGSLSKTSPVEPQKIATTESYMPGHMGNSFLMQFNPQTGLRNWGTFYNDHSASASWHNLITCDLYGNVYLAGTTVSLGFAGYSIATPGSHQDTLNTTVTNNPPSDAFIVQFDSAGKRKWATYYGGPQEDKATGITSDATGALYLTGTTSSQSDIATPGSYCDTLIAKGYGFIVKFLPVDIVLDAVVNPENDTACTGLLPLSVLIRNQGRMDKEDTLGISYSYTGPAAGSADTFFTGGLSAGTSGTFELNRPDLSLPGTYHFTIYLHYTRDDNERENDTLSYDLQVINAVPKADIDVYNVGTVFHFSNENPQPDDRYHWDFGDGTTSTEAAPTHEYAVTDSYLVTLIVTTPCASDTATIKIQGIGNGTGIQETELDDVLFIYPNPTEQRLYIKTGSGITLQEYTVVNILGQTLLKGDLQQKEVVDVSSLSAGSYFIRIRTNKGWMNKQFQVLKP